MNDEPRDDTGSGIEWWEGRERLRKFARNNAKRLPDQGDGIIRFEPRDPSPEEVRWLAQTKDCLDHGKLMEHTIPCPWDRKAHAKFDLHPCWPFDDEGKPLVTVEGPTFEETLRVLFQALRLPGYDGYIMNTCGHRGCLRLDHYRDP
jgi:hypothetical protein